ncbi:MAG: hypothetical protein AB9873_17810 [Syntrophobacteraceae bacterium]
MKDSTATAVVSAAAGGAIVRPAVSVEEALAAWKQYKDLRQQIIEPSDVQKIGDREFLKKSYWRKLEKFFNLRIQLMDESERPMKALVRTTKKKRKDHGQWKEVDVKEVEYYPMEADITPRANEELKVTVVFSAVYRAIAENGAYVDADGHSDIWEKGYPNSYHNAKATAGTRAKNRAISDLVGGGEESAEEMPDKSEATAELIQSYETRIKDVVLAAMEKFEFKKSLKEYLSEISPVLKDSPHAGEIRARYKELWDLLGNPDGGE